MQTISTLWQITPERHKRAAGNLKAALCILAVECKGTARDSGKTYYPAAAA